MKRSLSTAALALILFLPISTLADASADGLGPAASAPGTGASSADSQALQPAGTSPLQSSSNGTDQATSGDAAALQQPATSDNSALKVLVGNDADGTSTSNDHSAWESFFWAGFGLLLLCAGLYIWRKVRRRSTPVFSVPSIGQRADPPLEGDNLATPIVASDTQELADTNHNSGEIVHIDETAPPILGTNDEKTGDESAQLATAKPKTAKKAPIKHRKHGKR